MLTAARFAKMDDAVVVQARLHHHRIIHLLAAAGGRKTYTWRQPIGVFVWI